MIRGSVRLTSLCGKRIILSRDNLSKVPKRNGYLILVPEIGDDLPGKYPLLKDDKSPEFTNITIEKCVAAIGRQTLEFEEEVKRLEAEIKDVDSISANDLFKNILYPLEDLFTSLSITWGIAKTLYLGNQSLMPTQYYISINDRAKRASAAKHISVPIYQACKSVLSREERRLNDEQKGVLKKYILEGKLNGLDLKGKKSLEYSELMIYMLGKINEYAQKVQAATNHFTFPIKDPRTVDDFPDDLLKSMVSDVTKYKEGPWTVTLHTDVLEPFMEHCPDRAFRWKVWNANVIKASVLHDRLVQTSTLLEEIRQKRHQQANLLGYKTYSDLSMATKMAGNVTNVMNVMDNVLTVARPAQEYEIKELQTYANESGLDGLLQQWDIPYWGRKQLRNMYKYKEEDLDKYFPLPKVLSGLFNLVETLFNIKIVEGNKPDVWHKDVRYFDIFDLKRSSSEPVSSFYLDPYARWNEKVRVPQNAGYMVPIQNKSKISDMKPLAALIFNFQPPSAHYPSLLSFKDLRTLFRQFGHMLQHNLTTVEYSDIAGFSFVEWDAVFVSDYFMENWLYDESLLQQISCHHTTGEPLPATAIQRLKDAKTHLAGYNLCKELYLSHFDLELHSSKAFWNNIMTKIWPKYFVLPPYKKDCHICSFDVIFSGSWPAAYYSHTWSKMVASDVYSAFQEVSMKNQDSLKELGLRYRETFLSVGGTYSAREIFRRFRGRDPSPVPLLKELGLDVKHNMFKNKNEKMQKVDVETVVDRM